MDTSDFEDLLQNLDTNLDDLEHNLKPLLEQDQSSLTENLSPIERAKLHTHSGYTVLSLLFSVLKLNGVDAKQHPVYKELTRCRKYFEKIQNAETEQERKEEKNRLRLDKEAAARFIKHATAGNEQRTMELAERRKQVKQAVKRKRDETDEAQKETKEKDQLKKTEYEASAPTNEPHEPYEKQGAQRKRKKSRKSRSSKAPKSSKDALQALLQKSEKKSEGGLDNPK